MIIIRRDRRERVNSEKVKIPGITNHFKNAFYPCRTVWQGMLCIYLNVRHEIPWQIIEEIDCTTFLFNPN